MNTLDTFGMILAGLRLQLTRLETANNPEKRRQGLDWPNDGAETMIGMARLKNISDLADAVFKENVPGDFMECGVWRGGAAIYMAACINLAGQDGRRDVWVSDSFEGCPHPDPVHYPQDIRDEHHTLSFLAVAEEEVKANFKSYGLLNHNVHFLPGWFKDTLPGPVEHLALLRLDGDMYESTTEALEALYPKLSIGGYLILDDYQNILVCHKAIEDFRGRHQITEEIRKVDWSAVYWRKERDA